MFKSFKHKGWEEFFYTGNKKGIKPEQSKKIARILDRLNAANDIIDMSHRPPAKPEACDLKAYFLPPIFKHLFACCAWN